MKKNLLIAIALAVAFSAFWSCGDAFYDSAKDPNNARVVFQVMNPLTQIKGKESSTGQSIMGIWGYHEDSIRFRKSNKLLDIAGRVSINNSGVVIFYYVEDAGMFLKHDSTYSNILYITYPVADLNTTPFDGQTDSVKCEYHIVVRKGSSRIDYFKIYYNDSLYAPAGTYQFIKK